MFKLFPSLSIWISINVRLGFVDFTLNGKSSVLTLFPKATTVNCFYILNLCNHIMHNGYNNNLQKLWLWFQGVRLVTMGTSETCSNHCATIHKNEGAWSYFFLTFGLSCLKIVMILILVTARSTYWIFGNYWNYNKSQEVSFT